MNTALVRSSSVSTRNGVALPAPTGVLVVDDSAFDRELVGRLLGSMAHVEVRFARHGARHGLDQARATGHCRHPT